MRRIFRSIAAALVMSATTFGIAEVGARFVAWHFWQLTPRRARSARAAFLAAIPVEPSGGAPTVAAPGRRYVDMAYGARYEIHPYFGHTFFRGFGHANNAGFYTDVTYPYARHGGEFVIGIFGGSVAMQAAAAGDVLIAGLGPALRARGYDRVTVLPFAVGAWRQPQIFNALVYYADSIDMAIELDGFNEAIQLVPEQLRAYPASYPASDVFRPLASAASSPYATARLGEQLLANEAAASLTRSLDGSFLRRSMLAHLAWRVLAVEYQATVAALRTHTAETNAAEWQGIEPDAAAENIERYLRLYERTVRDAALVVRGEGKPYFHFVQPNQHVRGAKPLSDEERARFFNPPWVDIITPYYARLAAMARALSASGVDSTYLGDVFATTNDTVYADACCHLNARGTTMLDKAIVDHVLASKVLSKVTWADAR